MREDRARDQRIQLEEGFFVTFFRLLQAARLHQSNNKLVIKIIDDFKKITDQFAKNEPVITLQITAGRFYLQKEKLRYRKDMASLVAKAIQYFEKRQLHGLEFALPITVDESDKLFNLACLFNQAAKEADPAQWLEDAIKEELINWVTIMPKPLSNRKSIGLMAMSTEAESEDGLSTSQAKSYAAQQSYAHVLSSLRDVATKISADQPAGMRQTIRVVQSMVDLLMSDSFVLLGLSTLRDYDDYTYTHSVNVAILAMSIGMEIGLSRESLEMLGICGLFHDLGKVSIPHEILNKPGKLDDVEFAEIHKHTFYSVRQIIKLQIARDVRAKIMLPPFEHHLKYDLSGYPQTNRNKPISLFGRILTITDVYDAVTSPRIYRKTTMSPDQALGWMLKRSGSDFDPLLIKVFINMMGIYPPGTLVKLNTGEVGLVKSYEGERPIDRPKVVLLKTTQEGIHLKSDEIDLVEYDSLTGRYVRTILRGFHAGDYGIQPAQYIM